jgi:hypothetical protein
MTSSRVRDVEREKDPSQVSEKGDARRDGDLAQPTRDGTAASRARRA